MNNLSFLSLALVFACPAFPWGCLGHQVVGIIAFDELTPHARTMTARLLEGQPADPAPRRFCPPSRLVPVADLSNWADDIREVRKETAGWHFIDIPLGATRDHLNDACGTSGDCVTAAIRRQLEVLGSATSPHEQAEALLFVIHFAGDLHQPLHAVSNNDRGGNCLPVKFFDRGPELNRTGAGYHPNLHSVWDTDMVDRIADGREPRAFAEALRLEFAAEMAQWKQQPVNLDDWAWESHQLAADTTYGKLPRAVPAEAPRRIESCTDQNVGERMFRLQEEINAKYFQASSPVIRLQLARAGTRLAILLNQIWP